MKDRKEKKRKKQRRRRYSSESSSARSQRKHKKHKQKSRKYKDSYERQGKKQGREPNIRQKELQRHKSEDAEGWEIQNQQKLEEDVEKKEQPNFEPSGILLEYYNAREGVSLKFNEPGEAHRPIDEWRIYPFKDKSPLNPILLKQSCYLIGKDERVCDILCQNPSISRQHAVIQFRQISKMEIDGSYSSEVKPYIMDLQSTNGTFLNEEQIDISRYYQLLDKDVLKFGLSERQYVLFKVTP